MSRNIQFSLKSVDNPGLAPGTFSCSSGCHGDKPPAGWGPQIQGSHGDVLGGRGLHKHNQDLRRRSSALRSPGPLQGRPDDRLFSKRLSCQRRGTGTP